MRIPGCSFTTSPRKCSVFIYKEGAGEGFIEERKEGEREGEILSHALKHSPSWQEVQREAVWLSAWPPNELLSGREQLQAESLSVRVGWFH